MTIAISTDYSLFTDAAWIVEYLPFVFQISRSCRYFDFLGFSEQPPELQWYREEYYNMITMWFIIWTQHSVCLKGPMQCGSCFKRYQIMLKIYPTFFPHSLFYRYMVTAQLEAIWPFNSRSQQKIMCQLTVNTVQAMHTRTGEGSVLEWLFFTHWMGLFPLVMLVRSHVSQETIQKKTNRTELQSPLMLVFKYIYLFPFSLPPPTMYPFCCCCD